MGQPKKQKLIEFPADLASGIQSWADSQGTTFTAEVLDACRRHLAYPPERKPEPLPDSPAPAPAKGRRKKKGG